MFKRQWDERTNYASIKVTKDEWLVIRTADRKPSVIPQFSRTYTVRCKDGFFTCSCKHFELNGFACRHVLKVITSCSDYTEPTHHDFSVCHWKEYYLYSLSGSNKLLHDKLQFLRDNDITGPYHNPESVAKDKIVDIIPDEYERGSKFCCINYNFGNINYLATTPDVYGLQTRKYVTKNLSGSFEHNFEAHKTEFNDEDEENTMKLYDRLNPVFHELLQSLETNENEHLIKGVEDFMSNKIIECKTNNIRKFKKRLVGKMVSVNPPTEKRLKSQCTSKFYKY